MREPAFGGDIAQARRRGAILHRNDAENGRAAENNKRDDGDHFHQREPELAFGEEAGRNDVKTEDHRAEHHAPDPDRHLREPILHTEAGGGKARTQRHRPRQPVEPRHGIARRRAKVTRRVNVESAGLRHRYRQFAEALHHQPDHQGANQIRQQRPGRAGGGDDIAGIKEQAGANHAAERQHDQMARFHGALQLPTLLLCCALHFIFSRQPACPGHDAYKRIDI